jgi:hypothetical protein
MGLRGCLLFALIAAPACGSDGYTPACPELPLFDIRNAAQRSSAEVVAARTAAVEAGCLTAPAPAAPRPNGGSGGAAQPEGSAGDGGASPAP